METRWKPHAVERERPANERWGRKRLNHTGVAPGRGRPRRQDGAYHGASDLNQSVSDGCSSVVARSSGSTSTRATGAGWLPTVTSGHPQPSCVTGGHVQTRSPGRLHRSARGSWPGSCSSSAPSSARNHDRNKRLSSQGPKTPDRRADWHANVRNLWRSLNHPGTAASCRSGTRRWCSRSRPRSSRTRVSGP
jgi:hypothetical protein